MARLTEHHGDFVGSKAFLDPCLVHHCQKLQLMDYFDVLGEL
jgi:hypothetical protein